MSSLCITLKHHTFLMNGWIHTEHNVSRPGQSSGTGVMTESWEELVHTVRWHLPPDNWGLHLCDQFFSFKDPFFFFFLPQSLHSYIELKERERSTRVPSISQHITLAAGFWTKRPAALQSVFQSLTLPSIWKYGMDEACQWAVHIMHNPHPQESPKLVL